MFVRFRRQRWRLQASLTQTRRVAGKKQSEHISSLGSVDAAVSVRERIAFWANLPERLARLGNRVGADEHGKIIGALHARIPMVTIEDLLSVQEESAPLRPCLDDHLERPSRAHGLGDQDDG